MHIVLSMGSLTKAGQPTAIGPSPRLAPHQLAVAAVGRQGSEALAGSC